jgi:folate-dependent tRNA-U54 methylase TrmFO/GidA
MNINFGLFPPLEASVGTPPGGAGRKRERRSLMVERALRDLEAWKKEIR